MLGLCICGLLLLALLPDAEASGPHLQIVPPRSASTAPRPANGSWSATSTRGVGGRPDRDRPRSPATTPRSPRSRADGTVTPVEERHRRRSPRRSLAGRPVALVSVENVERDEPWSFRNHVEPVLTKVGCNSGACHGAAAGKNGFRLTLRGYAPEVDYDVLTRQALGRRIVRSAPAESLMLLKPTGAIEHGGGVKFATDSLEYRVLAEWIAAGHPGLEPSDREDRRLNVYPRRGPARAGRASAASWSRRSTRTAGSRT